MSEWHAKEKAAVLKEFAVDEAYGLADEEVEKRRAAHGRNELEREERAFWVESLFGQLRSPLVIILFVAFVGTMYLGEPVDAIVIAVALAMNVVISFIQEYRANRAFATLVASQEREVHVLRAGVRISVPSHAVVPGDIMFLASGDVVSADGYLLSSSDLSVSEAHLTGESLPVHKKRGVLSEAAPLFERTNMVFMGSAVVSGDGRILVVATGNDTEVGDIATGLALAQKGETPIEKSIKGLARFLSVLITIVIVMLVAVGALRGIPVGEIVLLAIALAVSVVPEGLPAAVTAILAIGMERILKERGLVRNLLAAETLGSTSIILTDKTGTLTEGRLALADVVAGEERGFLGVQLSKAQVAVLQDAVRVSDAYLRHAGTEKPTVAGRPIERAILSAALERNVFPDVFREVGKRIDRLSFSSERRFSLALYPGSTTEPDVSVAYALGAPELLLAEATQVREAGEVLALTKAKREALTHTIDALAREGKRVIAVAYREVSEAQLPHAGKASALLSGSVFSGIITFADPVRADVPGAIAEVQRAGVRVVMVTGDTPATAYSLAVESGIAKEGEQPVTGRMVEAMDDAALYTAIMTHHVFARILPKDKQRLVSVLQAKGETVAMTGDGVNDAPALKTATIGVAVGSGSEVAREASDLVLLGDSFSIIVAAIREGRRIMDNLKKAVVHLVTTSFHEVFLIGTAVLVGLPLPILPVQILWINILEEGFLTFGFAFEPGERGAMQAGPRRADARTVLTSPVRRLIMIAGVITGIFSVGVYLFLLSRGVPIEEIRTIVFVMLGLDALMFAVSLKQLHQPFWRGPLFNNTYLLFALLFSITGIVATLEVPFIRDLLGLVPPNPFDLAVLFCVALVNILTIEGAKYFTVERTSAIRIS